MRFVPTAFTPIPTLPPSRGKGFHRGGLTLVEMLITLAIVGVAAGVVVLGVGVGDRDVGVESEANRLADRLRLASDEVLVTRRPVALTFDREGYVFTGTDGDLAEPHRLTDGVVLLGLQTASPVPIDPDGTAVAGFGLAQGDSRWRVDFDGLNAVVTPIVGEPVA